MEESAVAEPVFRERLDGWFAPEAYAIALPLLAVSAASAWLEQTAVAAGLGALGLFVAAFFRNPRRHPPEGERLVLAPADGRVVDAGEIELSDGGKGLRVGIFLSLFDVHVNRSPVAGRVHAIARDGSRYRAAFDRRAERENVRLEMLLETAAGQTVRVVQITGWIARRIVCQPAVGDWLPRGARYGLIRFGSRTDVILPVGADLLVARGDRVRGGESAIGALGPEAG